MKNDSLIRNILDLNSVQRLGRIMKARYGAELTISNSNEVPSELLPSQAPLLKEGVLRIPLTDQHLVAIHNLPETNPAELTDIVQLVKLVFQTAIRTVGFDDVILVEESEGDLDNVIPLFDGYTEYSDVGSEASDAISKEKSLQTPAIFLATMNKNRLQKVISEIHQQSGRFACVPLTQMQSSQLSVQDLWSLGAATLVLEDLSDISDATQKLIYDYCINSRTTFGMGSRLNSIPLILAASRVPMAQLIIDSKISADFAFEIQRCVLEVDRLPVEGKLLRDAIELLLEPGVIL